MIPDLKEFLDEKWERYERPDFIPNDPIQIPHRFSKKQDIEIAGFLTASIAWGNRKSIITNATKMMSLMDEAPHDFIANHQEKDLERFDGYVHRTFNQEDLKTFVRALGGLYKQHQSLEAFFVENAQTGDLQQAITVFKQVFFKGMPNNRAQKHVADPARGSAAKRINMWLRWLVRPADRGVDFGIWKEIPTAWLSCPLDVHTGRVARELGLLKRKQNDAKALLELDSSLRRFDPVDPIKYDFALFGLGVHENL